MEPLISMSCSRLTVSYFVEDEVSICSRRKSHKTPKHMSLAKDNETMNLSLLEATAFFFKFLFLIIQAAHIETNRTRREMCSHGISAPSPVSCTGSMHSASQASLQAGSREFSNCVHKICTRLCRYLLPNVDFTFSLWLLTGVKLTPLFPEVRFKTLFMHTYCDVHTSDSFVDVRRCLSLGSCGRIDLIYEMKIVRWMSMIG